MKIIVASDIHGSNYYTKKFVKIIEKDKARCIELRKAGGFPPAFSVQED